MNLLTKINFVIPHLETNEEEIHYPGSRPARYPISSLIRISGARFYEQELEPEWCVADRIELYIDDKDQLEGTISISIISKADSKTIFIGSTDIRSDWENPGTVSIKLKRNHDVATTGLISPSLLRIRYESTARLEKPLSLIGLQLPKDNNTVKIAMRLFKHHENYCKKKLKNCTDSLHEVGVSANSMFVENSPNSASINRNNGFAKTNAEWVCFVDDDVVVDHRFEFAKLHSHMENKNIGCIAPKILTAANRVFCADPYFDDDYAPKPRGTEETDHGQYDYSKKSPWLPSTFLLVRRDVFLSVGGFSEEYSGSQVEDVDFCLKVLQEGYDCQYVGALHVVHESLQRNDLHQMNSKIFWHKWGARLPELLADWKKRTDCT